LVHFISISNDQFISEYQPFPRREG
jgi:hypothetical protein